MTKDAFEGRRRGFEEDYFRKQDTKLVDKLKSVFQKKLDREGLQKATGISDEGVLDNLLSLNLSGEVMSAFQLLPLIEIAWADGEVDEREARAVLSAAESHGIARDSAAYTMLENGLKLRPGPDSRKAWFVYATELRNVLNDQELAGFRNDLLDFANRVATASGGLLNIAFTISPNERRVLDAVEAALTHPGK